MNPDQQPGGYYGGDYSVAPRRSFWQQPGVRIGVALGVLLLIVSLVIFVTTSGSTPSKKVADIFLERVMAQEYDSAIQLVDSELVNNTTEGTLRSGLENMALLSSAKSTHLPTADDSSDPALDFVNESYQYNLENGDVYVIELGLKRFEKDSYTIFSYRLSNITSETGTKP